MAITVILFLTLFAASTVLGCGPLLPGQRRNLRFTVNNVRLALPMAYTEHPASRAMYPKVSESAMQVQAFVRNSVMNSVNDVLQQQGRGAGLSDAVISLILDQLTVNVTYDPLKCDTVSILTAPAAQRINNMNNCIVASEMVSSICTHNDMAMCNGPPHLRDIPQQHLTVAGSLEIGNMVMASWTDQMWQSVLNRVLQDLSSGQFGMIFQVASVRIN